jgi:hypothetical protein
VKRKECEKLISFVVFDGGAKMKTVLTFDMAFW